MDRDREFGAELAGETKFLRNYVLSRFRQSRADADDLVQDTLLAAWRARDVFSPQKPNALRSWCLTIIHNKFRTRLRHEKIAARYARECLDHQDPAISGGQFEAMELQDALSAILRIPREQQGALILGVRGESMIVSAQSAGTVTGTIKSRLSRARKAVREACA